MPAPFLIAPMLVSLSLLSTPATDARLAVLDPSPSAEAGAAVEALKDFPVDLAPIDLAPAEAGPVEQPLAGISVDLECLAYPDGYVANCAVVNETRPGLGFGEAAIALMNGSSVGSALGAGRTAPVKFQHTIEFTPD